MATLVSPELYRITYVPVMEILRNLYTSMDFDFIDDPDDMIEAMMKGKSQDGSFWELCDAIPRLGFTSPICITVDQNGWAMGNGHHRLTAAILLCIDEIPVYFSEFDSMCVDVTDNPKNGVLNFGPVWDEIKELWCLLWDAEEKDMYNWDF